MGRQKLSPKALKAKRSRDLEYANSDERKAKKAEAQAEAKRKADEASAKRRAAKKKHGENWLTGKDYDHSKGRFTSVKNNRGEYGNGTK